MDTVTKAQFPESKAPLARFAWKASKHTKSNAIVLAQEYAPGVYRVVGMGAGQPTGLIRCAAFHYQGQGEFLRRAENRCRRF